MTNNTVYNVLANLSKPSWHQSSPAGLPFPGGSPHTSQVSSGHRDHGKAKPSFVTTRCWDLNHLWMFHTSQLFRYQIWDLATSTKSDLFDCKSNSINIFKSLRFSTLYDTEVWTNRSIFCQQHFEMQISWIKIIVFPFQFTVVSFLSPINSSPLNAAYMRQWIRSALVKIMIMACRLYSAKPLSKPMLGYCQLDP